jgi:hypothetical protein
LALVSPAALAADAESVRIARDVLGASSQLKLAICRDPADLGRALERRGRRRAVVIGDDRFLQLVVQLLYQQATLAAAPVGVVPVGRSADLTVSRTLGVPAGAAEAARSAARGPGRAVDLLVDDTGAVALGGVRCSPRANSASGGWWTRWISRAEACRLGVELDGRPLAPVKGLAVSPGVGGLADVLLPGQVRARAQRVRVIGPFTWQGLMPGPVVPERTWEVLPGALTLA